MVIHNDGTGKMLLLYINLDDRTDRLAEITTELKVLEGVCEIQRVSAIKDNYGPIGCSKSHLLAAEIFEKSDSDIVLILEDDFKFTVDATTALSTIQKSIDLLEQNKADVVLLSCYNGHKDIIELSAIKDGVVRVKNMTSSVAYMYKKSYIPKIRTIMNTSIDLFSKGQPHWVASLDIVWRMYHDEDIWLLHVPDIGKQRPSYSDNVTVIIDHGLTYSESKCIKRVG